MSMVVIVVIILIVALMPVSAKTSVITERLLYAMNSTKNEIPVRIEFTDHLNLKEINKKAQGNVRLTDSEMYKIDEYSKSIINGSFEFDYITQNNKTSIQYKENSELSRKFNKYCLERINLMNAHYSTENKKIFKIIDCPDENAEISRLLPVIYKIMLTKDQIIKISKLSYVALLDIAEIKKPEEMIANSDMITRSTDVRAYGYTGSDIKIGVVELGYPNLNQLSDSSNVVRVGYQNGDTISEHAASVINVIQQIAPDCTIYVKPQIDRFNQSTVSITEDLIIDQDVHIVNLSIGICTNSGGYQQESRDFDALVRRTNRTIVTSAGNSANYINDISAAPNVITVGSVNSSGRTVANASSYTFSQFSSFEEPSVNVNKPDICAPGEGLTIDNFGTGNSGTSYSSPTVAAIIALMLDRNIWIMDKPQIIKAAVIISGRYHGNSSYVNNVSDREGCGVIDALTCYRVARNGRRYHFDFTASSSNSMYYNITADDATSPFRVAISWMAETKNSSTSLTDYDLYLYKGDTLVAQSTNSYNNYEIVEVSVNQLNTLGTGTYKVEVRRYGSMKTTSDRVGLAWEHY